MCGKFPIQVWKAQSGQIHTYLKGSDSLLMISWPGQCLEYELHVPVPGDDPLQTEPHVRVALALHGVVADLLRGLQEAREHGDHWAQRGLEPRAAADELLEQGDLNLRDMRNMRCAVTSLWDAWWHTRRIWIFVFLKLILLTVLEIIALSHPLQNT